MHFALFGGTGRVGSVLLAHAIAAGHSVNALVRDAGRLTLTHERLTVVEGVLDDGESVAATLAGTDAALVRRTVTDVLGVLRRREAGDGSAADGAVFLVVDGWGSARRAACTIWRRLSSSRCPCWAR